MENMKININKYYYVLIKHLNNNKMNKNIKNIVAVCLV